MKEYRFPSSEEVKGLSDNELVTFLKSNGFPIPNGHPYEYHQGNPFYFSLKNNCSYIVYDAVEYCFSVLNLNSEYHNDFGPAIITKTSSGDIIEYNYINGVYFTKEKFGRYICKKRIQKITS